MNKVITINLNGVAYQLEEGGYDALRAYLENAARRLEGNPDKAEILSDIEQAIADKFRALLGSFKTVVNEQEVADVLAEMGPVEDASSDGSAAGSAASTPSGQGRAAGTGAAEPEAAAGPGVRRLYRIEDGAMLAGVCNGIAAYVNLDVTIVRLAFTLLTFLWGTGIVVYALMAFIVPPARTASEKAAAAGMAATAQEFIKRAREGYYEGMRSFHDKESRRAWKRKFRQEMRGWKYAARHSQANYWKNWSYNWTNSWSNSWQQSHSQGPAPIVGPVFIAPLLSVLLFGLTIVTLYALYSLVTAHAVFGVALPATMPLWVGILLIIFASHLLAWPFKAARYACYYPGACHGYGSPFGGLIGLFFLGFAIWMLNRHVPEFHQWLEELPGLLHRGIDAIAAWFGQKT